MSDMLLTSEGYCGSSDYYADEANWYSEMLSNCEDLLTDEQREVENARIEELREMAETAPTQEEIAAEEVPF